MDRMFHLKFPKFQFMKGFANFVPGPSSNFPHWDALFKMYGKKGDLWSAGYGDRFSLELNGWHGMEFQKGLDGFISDDQKYIVVIKNRGFVPDECQFKQNKTVDLSEVINGLALLDEDRKVALDEFQKADLTSIDILKVKELRDTYMSGAKTGVREDGTTGYIGWAPWIEALQQILAAHPVKHVTIADPVYTPGRTIKGANIELHVGTEVYRTADFYRHGDKDSIDAKADPRTIGDYGGFKQCSDQENYSFASFHFEVVKGGVLSTTDE
jgi:hypothetical protein